VIRKFHRLLKQQKGAQGDELAHVNRKIEQLGGLEAYQRMSCIGQGSDRGGGSEKVLIGWLRQMGWADASNETKKKRHRQVQIKHHTASRSSSGQVARGGRCPA